MGKRHTPESFWNKVDKSADCWEWKGRRNPAGYGTVRYNQKSTVAHRVAYEMHFGALIPPGMLICHKCDNPPCCNPDHLFLGTHSDNKQDSVRKNRHKDSVGEKNPKAVLVADQVREIRRLHTCGRSIASIAREYEVGESTIRHIVQGNTWKHLL